ncbi:LysR family transcriptional regulator [uncultured Roseobacter sp.]|uniref:LysR family transcriptional regulator n=1 Tax=uncultured Roseobacter sp. TaxID=114847 RepID=UPI00260F3DFA|nr:LysR family transcriptional regulator [uncultured Roseobacter sp.]
MAKRALLRRLGDVDIRLIRIFVAVTECGGFAASELELNIGRSTISRHIADLEQRLGLRLCNRGPSGFSLTAEGERVLLSARRLLGSLDGFQTEVDEIHQTLTGTLRLGLFDQSTTNPDAHLDEAIRLFDRSAPEVTLEIALHAPNVLEAQVVEGSLDLAIVPIHRKSASLVYQPLYDEFMTLYCGRGHPLFDNPPSDNEVPDLSAWKYAGFGFNSPNLIAGQKLGLRRAARVQEEEALSLLIQSGCYLGYLADHVAATFLANKSVRPIAPEHSAYASRFSAITRKQPEPDRKTQEFLRCLGVAHAENTRGTR